MADIDTPLPGVYGQASTFAISVGYLFTRVIGILGAIGGWILSVFNSLPIIILVVLLSTGAFYWQNYHDELGESAEYGMRCVARPVYLEPIRPLIEIVQRIYNPTICWWNAVNWITFGIWREVVYPLALQCNVKDVFINIGALIETFATDFVAGYLASGDFLTLSNGIFNWGPGSDPFNQPNGQAPGGTGMLCERWLTLWRSWVDLYCCLCADLCDFLRLQPLFVIIGLPPIPPLGFPGFVWGSLWAPGFIASDQIGDEQLWRAVGHLFNAALNIVQQLWAIILYVLVVVIGQAPPNQEFPRPDFRVLVQLLCLAVSGFVRSCENAAQRFVVAFLPFPFDFRFFFCFIDATVCVALKLVSWILGILLNADRLGTQCIFPNIQDSNARCCPVGTGTNPMTGACLGPTTDPVEGLWATRFRTEWIEIANRIAPVHIPGYSLTNTPGGGGPLAGVPRLSECIAIFFNRLLCDPSQVCFDENAQPTPCTCYGQPIPTGIIGEFSLSCIVEAALSLIVDLLTALLDATYFFDNVLTYFTWLDDKYFDYLDIILIDDLVSEDIPGVRQPGLGRCLFSIFRGIPAVGRCIENLLVDFILRAAASLVVFLLKYLINALVINLVLALTPCTCPIGSTTCMGVQSANPTAPTQPEFATCTQCAYNQSPTAATPCFPRGWLLTSPKAKDDWERIWKPIIVQPDATLDENRRSAENCFCQILNLIPIPRLPCTNCESCGYIPASGPFIPCKASPFEPMERECNDPLTGPIPGQGITREDNGSQGVLSRSRKRVREIMRTLQSARQKTPAARSPIGVFQAMRRAGRMAAENKRMPTRADVDLMMTAKRRKIVTALHKSHERESPLRKPLEGWTRNYLRDSADPTADLSGYAPDGYKATRFDSHLVDRSIGDDGAMYGTDPETGKRHKVDERVMCTSPEGGTPGCFNLCCAFKRILRAAVRLLIQTGDFFDGLFFGAETDPQWQYFVGPESNLFVAPFEVGLTGLIVEIVELYQCYCNFIELIFPIPFLDLCCPIIAAAELVAEILLTLIKAIKSLALDQICLNPRQEPTVNFTPDGQRVFYEVGDTCAPPAVLDSNGMCCPSGLQINQFTGACTAATTPPFLCDPARDNFSYFTKLINEPGGIESGILLNFPAGSQPIAHQTGPTVEICDQNDPDGPQGPLTGEIGVLCDNCCKPGQSQFECDIDRMSDQTIVIIVCLCDIIRAMFPIPGLDLCCAVEAIAVTLVEVIRLVIQLIVNLGTINTTGATFFRIEPPPTALSPGDPGYVEPGLLDNIGLVQQWDVIVDTIIGVPGGRCSRLVPSTGVGNVPPQFTGGEAVGGAITCVCQILNWVIPARKYPSLPVGTCPDDDPNCDNCPILDLCCWVREPAFALSGAVKFLIRFFAAFWQEWVEGSPVVLIQLLFCDEYGEWDPDSGVDNPSGNIWPAGDSGIGNQKSDLVTATCAKFDPILRGLEALISQCPCVILRYVDVLLNLIFGGEQQTNCLCGDGGILTTLPGLFYLAAKRSIQFIRMFWSQDFWQSPDGPPFVTGQENQDGDPLLGGVQFLNVFPCASDPNSPPVPGPEYSGQCIRLPDGTIILGELYNNQTWARWLLLPIVNQLCAVVVSILCVPNLILGLIFGCNETRNQLVVGLAVWPAEAIIVALEFFEGIGNTFAGNCGDGIQYNFENPGSNETQVPPTPGAGLQAVNTACVGGALVGLLKFPINALIADGLLADDPGGNTAFLNGLLSELPPCTEAVPPITRVSGLVIASLRYLACILNRFTGGSGTEITSGASKAVLALAGLLSILWQISAKLLAVLAAFLNLVISLIGFSTGNLCACHAPWAEWYNPGPDNPAFQGPNLNSRPRWRQGAVFGSGLCYPCMIDPIVDCGGVSGYPVGTYYNPVTDSLVFPSSPGANDACPDPTFGGLAGNCFGCANFVNRSDPNTPGKTLLPSGNGVQYRPPDGYADEQYQCYWEQQAVRAKPLCSFLGVISAFFDFIGSFFNIFNPPPRFPPEALVSAARRDAPPVRSDDPDKGEDVDEDEQPEVIRPGKRRKRNVDHHVERGAYFHERARSLRQHGTMHDLNSTLGIALEAFTAYDTSDCLDDPVTCLCRNLYPMMDGVCSFDFDTMEVMSEKPGKVPVTPDDVLHRLGESCAHGVSTCDSLLHACGKDGWGGLQTNPALRYMWAECVELYVGGARVHAVDERFPSDFFTSHTGMLDLATNIQNSAKKFYERMTREGQDHKERAHKRQRRDNGFGLTNDQYDKLYLKTAMNTYIREHGTPQFPAVMSTYLRLDLKLHKFNSGKMTRTFKQAARNIVSGEWHIPPAAAAKELIWATADLGHFVARGINYREGISNGITAVTDAVTETNDAVRRSVSHAVNHGIFGERGLIQHWRREATRRVYGNRPPRYPSDAMKEFWKRMEDDELVTALFRGPAYQWWTGSWQRNLNPFKPFWDHIQRVRRVYAHTPEHKLLENNPVANTTLPRLLSRWESPWSRLKQVWRRRWMPRWDWRMHDWPEHKETPDRWGNVQSVATMAIDAYEVVYPDSVPRHIKERWVVGPGSNCDLISRALALIVDTFDYCATQYTFNLPPPDCQNITIIGNTTIIEPLPDIGCARRRAIRSTPLETTHDNVMPVHGDTPLANYLRRSARHRKGFLRDRSREWHHTQNQTHMVWQPWRSSDEYSYVRPKIVHRPRPELFRDFSKMHGHAWKRVMSFVTTGTNFYTWFFCWIEDTFLDTPISPEIVQFMMNLRDWLENPNIDPDLCGLPQPMGVGLKYLLTFPVRCEWPEFVNCSNACALGLKEGLRRVVIGSLIAFGGVAIVFPPILTVLAGMGGLLLYVIVIPAVSWHYSPQCWFIFPSIPIPGVGISVPILPFPIGLPVLPECLVDDFKALMDDILGPCPFDNFRGIVPLCLYNGDPCPSCPERIDLANCVNVGVADGLSNLAYLLWWISPGTADFVTGTLAQTCIFNGCLIDIFPFNLNYLVEQFESFENGSDTQQCRQQWCFWATIISIGLPLLIAGIGGGALALILVLLLDIIVSLFAVLLSSPVAAFIPGSQSGWVTPPGEADFYYGSFSAISSQMPMGSPYISRAIADDEPQEDEGRRRRRQLRLQQQRAHAAAASSVGIGGMLTELFRPAFSAVTSRIGRKEKKE
jgi:hypothetical protein